MQALAERARGKDTGTGGRAQQLQCRVQALVTQMWAGWLCTHMAACRHTQLFLVLTLQVWQLVDSRALMLSSMEAQVGRGLSQAGTQGTMVSR